MKRFHRFLSRKEQEKLQNDGHYAELDKTAQAVRKERKSFEGRNFYRSREYHGYQDLRRGKVRDFSFKNHLVIKF